MTTGRQLVTSSLLICLVALTPQAGGEDLSAAWAQALSSHPAIAAAEAEYARSVRGLDSARASRLPSLGLNSAFQQLDQAPRFAFGDSFVSPPLFSGDNFVTASASVQVPLFTSGRLAGEIGAARESMLGADASLAATRQSVKRLVAEAYLQVLRAESALEVAEASVASIAAQARDAKSRFDLGAVPRNDFLSASVSLAEARQGELQARNGLDLARAAYNRATGRAGDTSVALSADLGSIPTSSSDVEALIETAIAGRQELASMDAGAASLEARASASRARRGPQIALTAGYSLLETQVLDQDRFWTAGVAMAWQLFDGGRARAEADGFAQAARALRHRRADLEAEIALAVRQFWLDRKEARSRIAVAETAVTQADENLKVARDRYLAGAGTNADVLDAETLRSRSRNNLANARFDEALAHVRLAWATGGL